MVGELAKQGFGDFETFEMLERKFERRKLKETSLGQSSRGEEQFVFAQAHQEGRWHTGYLTFCLKY